MVEDNAVADTSDTQGAAVAGSPVPAGAPAEIEAAYQDLVAKTLARDAAVAAETDGKAKAESLISAANDAHAAVKQSVAKFSTLLSGWLGADSTAPN